jgi:hypothetical protein
MKRNNEHWRKMRESKLKNEERDTVKAVTEICETEDWEKKELTEKLKYQRIIYLRK